MNPKIYDQLNTQVKLKKVKNMQSAMHLQTAILPGGKIEITDLKLPAGKWVEVFILLPHFPATTRRSALEILAEAPGQRLFKTAEEVYIYIKEERDSWER
jgi:hypothetical protein